MADLGKLQFYELDHESKMRLLKAHTSNGLAYDHSFLGAFGQEFFSVSASVVCDSRNWDSRSNRFVRAPSSGGGPNAPRPAVSLPHLAEIGYVG